jgi:beta-glucosidase
MKMKAATRLALAVCLTGAPVAVCAQDAPSTAADRTLSPDVRAAMLVKQMTREEKLRLIHTYFPPRATSAAAMRMIPSAGHMPGVPRLGIPILRESDASLGVANQVEQRKGDVATALPAGLAIAATFDPELAYRGGAMIGSEARAKTFNVLLAGGVNLTRDPWNGRNFEYMGEDPLLAGVMAGEAIRGVESNHIVSTVKHLALNAQETGRHVLNAQLGETELRESDLLAFELAIERGKPGSVMCAYNKVNGDYACENDYLLNKVLKTGWGYKGWVMSDWGAVHSTEKAAMAGLDQQSGQELDDELYFGEALDKAVTAGRVPESRLDDMARRIVYGIVASGLIDNPVPAAPQKIDYRTNAEIAQRTAEEGIVLLKNSGDLLPIARTAKKIVLIGAHADLGVLSGGGSSQVRSVGGAPVEIPLTSGEAASFARITWHASSPLNAIRAALPGVEVSYVDGSDVAASTAAARGADLVIVFAWQWQTEAQDAETLSLPDRQDTLIEAVAQANRRTLVVLETGGPVLMPWIDQVPAVLQAWYPGQRGGEAIANILVGNVNPSGRLPMTFPMRAEQAPRPAPVGLAAQKAVDARQAAGDKTETIAPFTVNYPEGADVGYRWYAKKAEEPLFAFGYGQSYTRFRYANLTTGGGTTLTISFDVTNIGKRSGEDVPQFYAQPPGAGKAFRLAGWRKLRLDPGQTQRVTIVAEPRTLAHFDAARRRWQLDGGRYAVVVGHSAADPVLTGSATLETAFPASQHP